MPDLVGAIRRALLLLNDEDASSSVSSSVSWEERMGADAVWMGVGVDKLRLRREEDMIGNSSGRLLTEDGSDGEDDDEGGLS